MSWGGGMAELARAERGGARPTRRRRARPTSARALARLDARLAAAERHHAAVAQHGARVGGLLDLGATARSRACAPATRGIATGWPWR